MKSNKLRVVSAGTPLKRRPKSLSPAEIDVHARELLSQILRELPLGHDGLCPLEQLLVQLIEGSLGFHEVGREVVCVVNALRARRSLLRGAATDPADRASSNRQDQADDHPLLAPAAARLLDGHFVHFDALRLHDGRRRRRGLFERTVCDRRQRIAGVERGRRGPAGRRNSGRRRNGGSRGGLHRRIAACQRRLQPRRGSAPRPRWGRGRAGRGTHPLQP